MSLKRSRPETRFNGEKVDPDEINRYENYYIILPSSSTSWFGTAAIGTATQVKAFTITNRAADYPRNALLTIGADSGTLINGSAYVVGEDHFGVAQTETFGIALGTSPQSVAGTKIFSQITAATVTFGTAQVAFLGTASLGVATGVTAGSQVFAFGLPVKIGAASDVVALSRIALFTGAAVQAGTPSAMVSTTLHAFLGTTALGTADSYYVRVLSTYNSENDTLLS